MARGERFSSPMDVPYPFPNPDGDKRDVHDHNPSTNLQAAHERGAGDPSNNFVEGLPDGTGIRVGHTHAVSKDILSTPIGGQRRSATGEYESEPSIHKTQQQEQEELADRLRSPVTPWPHHREGRE